MRANPMLSAYEKALDTEKNQIEGVRSSVLMSAATNSRRQLREAVRKNPEKYKLITEKVERRGGMGGGVNVADLASIRAELESEVDAADDDESGEEEEEEDGDLDA